MVSGTQAGIDTCWSVRASLTRRGYPGPRPDSRTWAKLARDRRGHRLEVVDVALRVLVAHHEGGGPALPFRAGALEDTAVELREPRELRDPIVDRPEVAVLVDRGQAPVDRP